MCGITGYISKTNQNDLPSIINIYDRCNRHRGPDYQNTRCQNNIALGHSRLSIIDTSTAAHQPFSEHHVDLVYNGEIYNFQELKKEHLRGETFSSTSDTEVLIKLYLKYGLTKTVSLIRGMFRFTIYDKKLNKIFLVIDHIGKKPIYFIHQPHYFTFSSEIKSFKKIPNFKFEFNQHILSSFFIINLIMTFLVLKIST